MSGLLVGSTALVTGATRGIGAAAAIALSAAGARVIVSGRSQPALETVRKRIIDSGGAAEICLADLADAEAVAQLGPLIARQTGRLDIMVHSGAVLGGLNPVVEIGIDHWRRVMDVNVTATFCLLKTLQPLLLAAPHGRAIVLTSNAAQEPRALGAPYSASKSAVEALVECWREEIAGGAARACLLDPGRTRTGMRAEAAPGEDASLLTPPEAIARLIVELARPDREPPARVRFRDWDG